MAGPNPMEDEIPQTLPRRALAVTLTVLMCGLAAAAGLAWQDAKARPQLEQVCLPSGLGVDTYVTLPEPLTFQAELARFGGEPVFAASLNMRELQETELEVIVPPQPGEPPVFRRFQPAGQPDAVNANQEYFLKVGPGTYLRVHQGPEVAPFAAGRPGCFTPAGSPAQSSAGQSP